MPLIGTGEEKGGSQEGRLGSEMGNGKLHTEHVRRIRRLYATGEYSLKDLACVFHVDTVTIWAVVNRKSWKHVD
jgi:hypothetical protein